MGEKNIARREEPLGVEAKDDTVGRRIALVRLMKNMTQAELAKHVGKSRASIVQYEQGNIYPPVSVVQDLAGALDVQPGFLAFGRKDTEDSLRIGEVVAISEVSQSEGGELRSSGHIIGRNLLKDFKIEGGDLVFYALTHDAPRFELRSCDRVLIDAKILDPNRDHSLFLTRSSDGVEVVDFDPSLNAQKNKVSGTTGNGRYFTLDRTQIDIIGAIVGSIRSHVR